jgi:hypothetical protein
VGFAHLFRLTYPASAVEICGVGELHAAFLKENRTRGAVWAPYVLFLPVGLEAMRNAFWA